MAEGYLVIRGDNERGTMSERQKAELAYNEHCKDCRETVCDECDQVWAEVVRLWHKTRG